MKKILKNLVLICFMFFVFIGSTKAEAANAEGEGGASAATGGTCQIGWACGFQTAHRIKVRLVYYNGTREEIIAGPTEVAPEQWGWYTVGNEYAFDSDKFEETVVGNNDNAQAEKRKKLQQFVNDMGWNVNLNTLNKTSCEVDRKGNCYGQAGYRVIAELYLGLATYNGAGIGDNYQPIKTLTAGAPNFVNDGSIGKGWTISNKMRIAWADINYTCKGGGKHVCQPETQTEDVDCLVEKNCGYGIWIVDISKALSNDNDYSLDSACVGCDRQGKDDISYIIQDVDNWKLLAKLNELDNSAKNKSVKNYFTKGIPGQICREEYHISFPNNSKVSVENGGYFTINEDREGNNFKPIHVDRIIKCKTNNGTDLSDGDTNKLKDKFCRNSDLGDSGKVKIWYNEVNSNGSDYPNGYKYGWNDMEKANSGCGVSRDSEGAAVLIMSSDYKLNENVYRYIRKGSAKPTHTKVGGDAFYTTLSYPNFPVHFEHRAKNTDELAGKISVRFDFPDDSTMAEAFKSDNNSYLTLKDQEASDLNKGNIYKRYIDNRQSVLNDEISSITIKNSACAKMFGFDTAEFKICVDERKDSAAKKISICRNQNNTSSFASYTVKDGKRIYNGYTCEVLMSPNDGDNPYCKIISTEASGKYIGKGGKAVSKSQFITECCTEDNYRILGVGFDYETGTCTSDVKNECNASNVGTGEYEDFVWAVRKSTGQAGCCSTAEMLSKECERVTDECNESNVGTGRYRGYVWAKRNSTGQLGCCTSAEIASKQCEYADKCTALNVGKGKYRDYTWGVKKSTGQAGCCSSKEIADKECEPTGVDVCNKSNVGTGKYKDYTWGVKKSTGQAGCCSSKEIADKECEAIVDECNEKNVGTGVYNGFIWAKKTSTGQAGCCSPTEIANKECSVIGNECNASNVGKGKYKNYTWAIKKSTGQAGCCSAKEMADKECEPTGGDVCNASNVGTGKFKDYTWAIRKSTNQAGCCSAKEMADKECSTITDECNASNVGKGKYKDYTWAIRKSTNQAGCCSAKEMADKECSTITDECNASNVGTGKYAGYIWAKRASTGKTGCCSPTEIANKECTVIADECNASNVGKGKFKDYTWEIKKSTGQAGCCSPEEKANKECGVDNECNSITVGTGKYAGYIWAKKRSTGQEGCCSPTEMANNECYIDECNAVNVGTGKYTGYIWAKRSSTGKAGCCSPTEIANKECSAITDECNASNVGKGKYKNYTWAIKNSTGQAGCCSAKEMADKKCSTITDECNASNVGTGRYKKYTWEIKKSTGQAGCCSPQEKAKNECSPETECNASNVGTGEYAGYVWAKKRSTGQTGCCSPTEMANNECENTSDSCNAINVGTGKYKGYVWAKKRSTGQAGCCSPTEIANNECEPLIDECNAANVGMGKYKGYIWAIKKSTGKYGCCSPEEKANNQCDGKITGCNIDNVGTGEYVGYFWARIKRSTGEAGCCSPEEKSKGECDGKIICRDGIDGPCGDGKLCPCSDGTCPNAAGECSTTNRCEHSGSVYKVNGQTVDKKKYAQECCNSTNASELGLEWNDKQNVCCAEGEVYNKLTGLCIKGCESCDSAELCCEPNTCGQFSTNKDYCDEIGAAWDGYKCLVCHGKPICKNASCSDELVYRSVELSNPFIGQEGKPRNTGTNWAALSPDGRFYDTKSSNSIVKSVFNDKSYDESHVMYKFTLDTDLINDIRKYNSNQKSAGGYSDFTLRCTNGVNCKSEFIKNIIPSDKKSGRCLNGSTDPICR